MIRSIALALPLLVMAAPASAQKEPPKRPEAFEKLVSCRTVTDPAMRLACYDTQVERLDAAERANEVVVVDKAEVKKARRGLFGLALPDLGGVFGRGKDGKPDEELAQIESTITSVKLNATGRYVLVIEDGARWVQSDVESIRTPKVGMKIRIRRAALGSFMANINDRPGIRVRREN